MEATASAYIAVGCELARQTGLSTDLGSIGSPKQAVSLQRLDTTATHLQLLVVSVVDVTDWSLTALLFRR
jgi:hypothetical protein